MKKTLFLSLYFFMPLLLIILIFYSNTDKYSDISYFFPMATGAAAYTFFMEEFIMIARPKFIEKYFGLDKFYKFHAIMAVVALLLAYIHKETELIRRFSGREFGENALNIFLVVSILALIFMADIIVMKIKPLFELRKYLEQKKLSKYEFQVLIHNITVLGIILLFIHVYLTTASKLYLSVRIAYIIYFGMGLCFYCYHKFIKIIIMRSRRFTVSEVIKEADGIYTFRLKPLNGKIFDYKAGQFGFVRFFGKAVSPEEHPFSFSSSPDNKAYISITIKELGDFTSKMKNIAAGTKVFLDGPYGNFSYTNYPDEKNTVLIAGGIGITPAISMVRFMGSRDKNKKVMLLWGIRSRDDLICLDEIEEIQKTMKNFKLIPIASNDDSWEGEKGFVDKEKIERLLKGNGFLLRESGFYICGPKLMLESVLKSLKQIGIQKRNVHFESFSL